MESSVPTRLLCVKFREIYTDIWGGLSDGNDDLWSGE